MNWRATDQWDSQSISRMQEGMGKLWFYGYRLEFKSRATDNAIKITKRQAEGGYFSQ